MAETAQRFEERVLIVEDDSDYRRYLELRLQHEGATTWLCGTGETALDAVAEFKPTVVITDIGLPGIDGLTVCRRLRADPQHRRLPILLLSSADHSAEVGEVVGLGLIWYLRKGSDWQVTARTLRNLVGRAREVPLAS
ncbi:MAG: response regulator [Candidatus Dormibacteraeota bacterium]|jgi:DNA-binding response OmpR family regulator|nr:response regulator [Candidatus Dormibacteraeota bacterium]